MPETRFIKKRNVKVTDAAAAPAVSHGLCVRALLNCRRSNQSYVHSIQSYVRSITDSGPVLGIGD